MISPPHHASMSAEPSPSSDLLSRAMREQLLGERARDSVVDRACTHHLSALGGMMRARLGFESARQLGFSQEQATTLALVPELLHNASLIHDDVQDRDRERRGQSSLWYAFSPDVALCVGDLHISAAYGCLERLADHAPRLPRLIAMIHQCVRATIRGQAAEFSAPSDDDFESYRAIAIGKTAPLIELALTAPLLLSGHDRALAAARQAADHFALAYQIADDLEDDQSDLEHGYSDNLVHRLRRANDQSPHHSTLMFALDALETARTTTDTLPFGAEHPLHREIERLHTRLTVWENVTS
ncbi:polyprenyl synthetase family protein [Larsenimonas salina]|uniref:polyprenyl synthetase family protein n=1 Tax=Larsenimonas salina TaxID=1295565 RepID=UPI00207376BF|nr:polyprenyl synthetase family protein [Larsenimonas salina]MCM5703091.1 polyprenyl synthetase family protein [Larsenimonas salina]